MGAFTSVGLGDRARKSRGSQPKPVGAVIPISFWSARQRWRGSNITPPSRTERLTRSCGVSAPPTAGVPARWIRDPLPLLDREARGAVWSEIDLKQAIWTIPGSRVKMGRDHRVRLSPAALSLLKALPRRPECHRCVARGGAVRYKDVSISVPETCQHQSRKRVKALN